MQAAESEDRGCIDHDHSSLESGDKGMILQASFDVSHCELMTSHAAKSGVKVGAKGSTISKSIPKGGAAKGGAAKGGAAKGSISPKVLSYIIGPFAVVMLLPPRLHVIP